MDKERPQLSVVTTVYKSEAFLEEFLDELYETIRALPLSNFEIIFVNDGSPDNSLNLLLKLKREQYPEVSIIDLSKNFGHHYAILAGLSYSKGENIFLIDCDLETRPAFLKELLDTVVNSNVDVAYGYQESRKGGWFIKRSGDLYWRLFNMLSETQVPNNVVTARVMNRNFVDAILELGDRNLFLGGLFHWVGFRQVGVPVIQALRKGPSTYDLRRKIDLFVNSITSFSAYPLQLIFNFGISVTVGSAIFSIFLIAYKLLRQEVLSGWTSLAILIFFSLGILTTCIGVIGIYLAKIFSQVQNRPLYIVRNIF